MAEIKRIPSGEVLKVTAKNLKGETYLISQSSANRLFHLYKKEGGKLTKIDKSRTNPLEFTPIIHGK